MVVAVKYRVKPVNKKSLKNNYKCELWTFRFSEGQSNLRLTNCLYFFLSEQSQVSGIGQAAPKPPEAVIHFGEHHV